uniref:Uncharacterized protein n=1 Tax=Globodera rostochiensis TaxID=31243 RepID=A0A914IDX8_GLORO
MNEDAGWREEDGNNYCYFKEFPLSGFSPTPSTETKLRLSILWLRSDGGMQIVAKGASTKGSSSWALGWRVVF